MRTFFVPNNLDKLSNFFQFLPISNYRGTVYMPESCRSMLGALAGKFPSKVAMIGSSADLEVLKMGLAPGDFLAVNFSATWCQPCKVFNPIFQKMALQAGGAFRFAKTENDDVSHSQGISAFPTIILFGGDGKRYEIQDRFSMIDEAMSIIAGVENLFPAYRKAMLDQVSSNAAPPDRFSTMQKIHESMGELVCQPDRLIQLFSEYSLDLIRVRMARDEEREGKGISHFIYSALKYLFPIKLDKLIE